ncbi:MAG: ribonuclease HIII [Planctomycetota bacterium]
MNQQVYVTTLSPAAARHLEAELATGRYAFRSVPHAVFSAQGESVTVTCYRSGKLVVQGAGTAAFVQTHLAGTLSDHELVPITDALIGSDESGKGDYFGPLVVAACYAAPEHRVLIEQLGVRDSKAANDALILRAEQVLAQSLPHAVNVLAPEHYNRAYAAAPNLNVVLGRAHADCIERVLEQVDCRRALADKFGDERYIREALGAKGRHVRLEQRTHAEDHPAVAAASFLARAAFLRAMCALEQLAGMSLPRGSSASVEAAARALVARLGRDALGRFAKLHFKTTARVLASS